MPTGREKSAGVWMWTLGRWINPEVLPMRLLACASTAASLLFANSAWAQWEAVADDSSSWLKLSVNESLYTSLGMQALEQLRILDAAGREQAFAICTPQQAATPTTVQVPVVPLNVGLRARFDASGKLVRQGGPGVEALPPWTDWVLDLRDYPQDVISLTLPVDIDVSRVQLRSSPNAQQWSRPLPFRAQGQTALLANPETITLLRIDIDGGTQVTPSTLAVALSAQDTQAQMHWFPSGVPSGKAARVQRPYGIQGARLPRPPATLEAVSLASRLNPGDAWKSRGQWQAGSTLPVLRLAAVGDREWRLQTEPAKLNLDWELGHAAHELRLPAGLNLPLRIEIGDKPSQQLRCDDRRWRKASTALSLTSLASSAKEAQGSPQGPTNVRPWFLVIVAAGVITLWWRKRRR